MKRILTVFGTRPEAIKLAPVILELRRHSGACESRVCVTAQHREMLDQVLEMFGIEPDIDLDLMRPNQTLPELTAAVIESFSDVIASEKPDVVVVQGDTTTVMAAALAAYYQKIPVAHVEAGLRSGDLYSPFPEEANRRLVSVLARFHFAPTAAAAAALKGEGADPGTVIVTGNPVIDALLIAADLPPGPKASELLTEAGAGPHGENRMLLLTAHRRENFGDRMAEICEGIRQLAERNRDIRVIYPVHLNENVREPVFRLLADVERVILVDPVDYGTLVQLMKSAYLVLTDSGGIQEEAPALGKPVLVLRTETERPEGVKAGTAKLVGPIAERIVSETELLLNDSGEYGRMARATSPYGDGWAAGRIVEALLA